jgi:hypothetical protein
MANGYFDTKSLFGTTPEELQRTLFDESQKRRMEYDLKLADMSATPGATFALMSNLNPVRYDQFGSDPRVQGLQQKEDAAREIFSRFSGKKTPEEMMQMASELMGLGMVKEATDLINAANSSSRNKTADILEMEYWQKEYGCAAITDPAEQAKCRQRAAATALQRQRALPGEKGQSEQEKNYQDTRAEVVKKSGSIARAIQDITTAQALLTQLDTGGFTNEAKTQLQRIFGSVPGSKARFNQLTGSLMLKQLKELFGGLVSDSERQTLKELEANLSQSKGANEALLQDIQFFYERKRQEALGYLRSNTFGEWQAKAIESLTQEYTPYNVNTKPVQTPVPVPGTQQIPSAGADDGIFDWGSRK